jgi:hypothetical protein
MNLFERIEAPRNADLSQARKGKWFTFSKDFYTLLPVLKSAFKIHGAPVFVHSRRSKIYNYSFHVELKRLEPSILSELNELAKAMKRVRVGNELNFYTGLINRHVSGELFQFLFSYLRASLAQMDNNELASLYPPLTVTNNEDEFPLHCDLYVPQILFNVFE